MDMVEIIPVMGFKEIYVDDGFLYIYLLIVKHYTDLEPVAKLKRAIK